jgi:hypothetical protein
MGYPLEINSLLVLPKEFPFADLAEGKSFSVMKDGSRLFPIEIPLEFCNPDYKYLGKAKIGIITVKKESTEIEFTVLKMFTENESEVFSENFIKP